MYSTERMRFEVRGTAQPHHQQMSAEASRAGFDCIELREKTIQMIIFSRAMAIA
jgi:hypothetical protein